MGQSTKLMLSHRNHCVYRRTTKFITQYNEFFLWSYKKVSLHFGLRVGDRIIDSTDWCKPKAVVVMIVICGLTRFQTRGHKVFLIRFLNEFLRKIPNLILMQLFSLNSLWQGLQVIFQTQYNEFFLWSYKKVSLHFGLRVGDRIIDSTDWCKPKAVVVMIVW
jgi:hypothetical protein